MSSSPHRLHTRGYMLVVVQERTAEGETLSKNATNEKHLLFYVAPTPNADVPNMQVRLFCRRQKTLQIMNDVRTAPQNCCVFFLKNRFDAFRRRP